MFLNLVLMVLLTKMWIVGRDVDSKSRVMCIFQFSCLVKNGSTFQVVGCKNKVFVKNLLLILNNPQLAHIIITVHIFLSFSKIVLKIYIRFYI